MKRWTTSAEEAEAKKVNTHWADGVRAAEELHWQAAQVRSLQRGNELAREAAEGRGYEVHPRLKEQVEHPDHYNQLPKETIQAIEESMPASDFEGYLQGNVLKYILRFRFKGMPLKDLMKARWYLDRMIEGRKEG